MEGKVINNAFYDTLHEGWYTATDHPIALLRAENAARAPWVIATIAKHFPHQRPKILDIGCGGGLLTNPLAANGYPTVGIDLSEESLTVAARHDTTQTVHYLKANAYAIPFPDNSFDSVCAMDLLEHVEEPQKVIAEASRLLRPGGLFFFHTFNRTWLSWLIAIKGVDWLVANAPKHMHLHQLFLKPNELHQLCNTHHLTIAQMHGLMPRINLPFFKSLLTRRVHSNFAFTFTNSLSVGYIGFAKK